MLNVSTPGDPVRLAVVQFVKLKVRSCAVESRWRVMTPALTTQELVGDVFVPSVRLSVLLPVPPSKVQAAGVSRTSMLTESLPPPALMVVGGLLKGPSTV